MKQLVQRAVRALGYEVVPTWRLDHYAQANFLRELFALLDVDCVFDVGANRGQFRDFLRAHVGYRGPVVSFEAIPELGEFLRQRAASEDPLWQIESYALGRVAGTASFNVMRGEQFSSFLQPDHHAVDRFRDINQVQTTVDVELRTLAEVAPALLARYRARSPYLKLDTQGFDLEVAAGAGEALRAFVALQTEASVQPIYQGMPDFATAIQTFREKGFELSGMFPNNPGHFPRLIEFDCHMVASSRLNVTQPSVLPH